MSRLEGAILAVRQAIATAADIPVESAPADEDLVDDLCLDELERESAGLILEEVFGVVVPDELWDTPLYRTPAALAEWIIEQSNVAGYRAARQERKRA